MAASSVGSLRWVIGLPIFIAFTCCLVLNAASQLLEDANPTLAATLNPLNTDARVNVLVDKLNAGDAPIDQLADEARALVTLSSADARGYSLVGAIEERRGDVAAASAFYAAALDHSRTERYALTRMLSLSLDTGDIATATRYFDLLLRRWGEYAKEIAPLANDLINEPEGAAALNRALSQNPSWRRAIVAELLTNSPGTRFVADLLVASQDRGRAWRDDLVAGINQLLRAGAPGEAYALFHQTLSPAEANVAGYVFDPTFSLPTGRRGFEWTSPDSSTVDASLPASPGSPGLRMRFLDSPAKLGRPSQRLYLPPGPYSLSATATGTALALPKGLFWQVTCAGSKAVLGKLDMLDGTYSSRTVTADFSVPANCPLQSLSLQTGVTTSSWRDRYVGEIIVTDIHVSRAGTGT